MATRRFIIPPLGVARIALFSVYKWCTHTNTFAPLLPTTVCIILFCLTLIRPRFCKHNKQLTRPLCSSSEAKDTENQGRDSFEIRIRILGCGNYFEYSNTVRIATTKKRSITPKIVKIGSGRCAQPNVVIFPHEVYLTSLQYFDHNK